MEVNFGIDQTQVRDYPVASPYKNRIPDIASSEDYAVCRRIMRAASKNYSSASNYLPGDLLPHVEALYALMRVGDDRVDVSHEQFASPRLAIDDWERCYVDAFQYGYSPHPVMRAYLDTALRFGIPQDTMRPYFRAMREDLTVVRYPQFADLLHYMEGSALPVGRAMTYILGVRHPYILADALPGADSLSIAMQLSNFWRDIAEDWQRGRIYIPKEDMDLFNLSEDVIAAGKPSPKFIELMEYQFDRTQRYYEHARRAVPMLAAGRWAVMSALEIYAAIIPSIRSAGYDVFTRRAGTNTFRKLGLAVKAFWQVRQN